MNRSIIDGVGDELENQDPSETLTKKKTKGLSGRLAYRKKRFSFESAPKRTDLYAIPLASRGSQEKSARTSLGSSNQAGQSDPRPCSPTESVSSNYSTMTQSTARGRLSKFIKDKNSKTKVIKSEKTRSDSDPLCPKVLRVRIRNILAGCEPISREEQGAAIKIQCSVRVYLAHRKVFLSFYARKLQAIWRGFHLRKSLEKKHEKATAIQARWRAYNTRSSYLYYKGAVQIQSTWRCHFARQRFLHHQNINAAATSIQTAWRSFFAYYNFAYTIHCVTITQKIHRGRVGRKIAKELAMREERRKQLRSSAITIQRHFRGLAGRKTCLNIRHDKWLNETMARFQANWRAHSQQRKFWHIVSSAIQIQSFARSAVQQIRYLDILWAVVLLQTTMRGYLARTSFKKTYKQYFLNKAATKIQASWRASVARKNYQLHEGARIIQRAWRNYCAYCDFQIYTGAQKLQTAWRGYSMRRKYIQTLTAIHAATQIQSAWRSFMCRGDYIFTIIDIITIQRLVRGIEGRKVYKIKADDRAKQVALENLRIRSASTIQRVFRGHVGRCVYYEVFERKLRRDAAILIQAEWRRYDAEQILWQKIESTIQIQSLIRGTLARFKAAEHLGGIIVLQSIARRWFAIRQMNRLRFLKSMSYDSKINEFRDRRAVVVLQYFYWDIVKPQYTIKCAIKIQSFFRMVKAMVDVYMLSEIKRKEERKERKLREERLKNRDENIENLMLEEAWSKSVFSSNKSDKVQEMLETIAVPEVAKKSDQQKTKRRVNKSKRSKGRSHSKQQSKTRNSQKAKKQDPSRTETISSARESVLDDALEETWQPTCQEVKNETQTFEVKEISFNDSNDETDDQSIGSFSSSIATKTSLKADQNWEFTYGQSDDLKNLGAENTGNVKSTRRSSRRSKSKEQTKKQSKRSRSKDPSEKLPSDSSVRRSNKENAEKNKTAKKVSTQEQMLNRISSTGAKAQREKSAQKSVKESAKLIDEALDDLSEVESKDASKSKMIASSSPGKKSTILSTMKNDALDEAWEVMLVDSESKCNQDSSLPENMESLSVRSTSRSKTRTSQSASPSKQRRRKRSSSRSVSRSHVCSNSPLRKEEPDDDPMTPQKAEKEKTTDDLNLSQEKPETLESKTKPVRSTRSRAPSKSRFHVRSSSPLPKQSESQNETELNSGTKIQLESKSGIKRQTRYRSASPAMDRYQLKKEVNQTVAKPPPRDRSQILSTSPFKMQQDAFSQISKARGRSMSNRMSVMSSPTPPRKAFTENSSTPKASSQKTNKNYGMPPSKSRFQVRSRSPSITGSRFRKPASPTNSANGATSNTSGPVLKDKLITRDRSASPANITECLTMSTCDTLNTNSFSENRLPPANDSTRGRSRSRSRREILQNSNPRNISKPSDDNQDCHKILIDLD